MVDCIVRNAQCSCTCTEGIPGFGWEGLPFYFHERFISIYNWKKRSLRRAILLKETNHWQKARLVCDSAAGGGFRGGSFVLLWHPKCTRRQFQFSNRDLCQLHFSTTCVTMWPQCSVSTAGFIIERQQSLCSGMANRERNKKILLELVKRPDNSVCADCGAPGKGTESPATLNVNICAVTTCRGTVFISCLHGFIVERDSTTSNGGSWKVTWNEDNVLNVKAYF